MINYNINYNTVAFLLVFSCIGNLSKDVQCMENNDNSTSLAPYSNFDTYIQNGGRQVGPAYHFKKRRRQIEETDRNILTDPVFNEILDDGYIKKNGKRGAVELYKMVKCATGCNPLIYKGYGCYCGFLGSGGVVDGIDRCCKMHDWCYSKAKCKYLASQLPYFVSFKWTCNHGAPYCITGKSGRNNRDSCGHQLCECDREFVHCLKEFPCPKKKAMCRSPWRYWQNLFMGLGTGMEVAEVNNIHGPPHPLKPKPLIDLPQPKFYKKRLQFELL